MTEKTRIGKPEMPENLREIGPSAAQQPADAGDLSGAKQAIDQALEGVEGQIGQRGEQHDRPRPA